MKFGNLIISACTVALAQIAQADLVYFNNNLVWTTSVFGGKSEISIDDSKIVIQCGNTKGKKHPKATLISAPTELADFWSGPVSLKISGYEGSVPENLKNSQAFRIGFTSDSSTRMLSLLNSKIAVHLTANGRLRIFFGIESGDDFHTDGRSVFMKPLSDPERIDSLELKLDGRDARVSWTFIVGRDGTYEELKGKLSAADSDLLKNAWGGGESRVVMETQLSGAPDQTSALISINRVEISRGDVAP